MSQAELIGDSSLDGAKETADFPPEKKVRKHVNETVIEPPKGWVLVDWKELVRYKDVFYFLVLRDITVLYKQTILGYAWAIIRPVFTMVIFTLIFGRMIKVPTDGAPYPIFSYSAVLPWSYFAAAMAASTQSLVSNARLFTKVYFPRLIIPMTPVFSKLADFGIAFIVLIGMLIWYGFPPTWNLLAFPLLLLIMIMTALGVGAWLSALSIQYRDVKHVIPLLTQLLMFAAPVVWPASLIPSQYRLLYGLYPMAGVIEGFRAVLIGRNPIPWDLVLVGGLSALSIALSGVLYFHRKEHIFADVA